MTEQVIKSHKCVKVKRKGEALLDPSKNSFFFQGLLGSGRLLCAGEWHRSARSEGGVEEEE